MSPRAWSFEVAKTKFSELVKQVENGEPQVITKDGHSVVAVISYEEFLEFQAHRGTSLEAATSEH
jgi:prevent-host-death family protein